MIAPPRLRPQVLAARALRPSADLGVVLEPLLRTVQRVASYVPLPHEPGTAPRPGWLLPVLLPDGDLDWAAYDGRLEPGPCGLQQPVGRRLGREALASCDLVLVPALLVDRAGFRLGRGGGSYDRALGRATGRTLALVDDGELVEQLPAEPHDVAVHAVVTPSLGVVALSARWQA